MKALRWIGIALAVLLVAIVGLTLWVANTSTGTRWALHLAERRMGDGFSVGEVEGALSGTLTLRNVRYAAPDAGPSVAIDRVELNLDATQLLTGTLDIERARIEGANVRLPAADAPAPTEDPADSATGGFSLDPPLPVTIGELNVTNSAVRRGDELLLQIDRAALAGRWTQGGLVLEKFDLHSPQGEVQVEASVDGGEIYTGKAEGRFEWAVGETTYRGRLDADTEDGRIQLEVRLDAPFDAALTGGFAQSENPRWEILLHVPTFDPGAALLPGSGSLSQLGAHLQGSGDLDEAHLSGEVTIDDKTIELRTLDLAMSEDVLRIESLVAQLREGDGTVRASGQVFLGREPLTADLALRWTDIEIPESLAGQVLRTHGELHVSGGLDSYTAEGDFALGPPGELAQFDVALEGGTEKIRIERLRIDQASGRLTVEGTVELAPRLSWDVSAQAENFDPGRFAAAWEGNLDLQLSSTGTMTDEGPRVQLEIARLQGTLRARPVSGFADLAITPDHVLSGELHLESGESVVDISSTAAETTRAEVTLRIASLDDWLPAGSGSVQANFTVSGEWPGLSIAGTARSEGLGYREMSLESLRLEMDVANVTRPSGRVQLRASDFRSGAFELETVTVDASGGPDAHELSVAAAGEPVSAELRLTGAFKDEQWRGTLQKLQLALSDALELELQDPAELRASAAGAFALSQACLADGDVRLCLAAERTTEGALAASYTVEAVPLALADALTPDPLPVEVAGEVSGEGEIRRAADGRWFGQARIASASAQVVMPADLGGAVRPMDRMEIYRDLELAVELDGSTARATASAVLMEEGRLEARLAASEWGSQPVPIEGQVEVTIPTLEPLAPFVPQVGELAGQIRATIQIDGTVAEPEISGAVTATQLAARISRFGIKVQDGTLRVEPGPGESLAITGSVHSGEGQVMFDGTWDPAGTLEVAIEGSEFLAADLPGAYVVITPDLTLTRDADGIDVTGEVAIPSARIDVQKLPRGGPQGLSGDVVVVDREAEEKRQALPVEARVTVALGEDVQLSGYGLDASLAGRLTVIESPGAPTTASGEILVDGRFTGYGQDLEITRGRILYAGTPIARPRVNITAVREIEDVTAGLRITGTAPNPDVTVFSNPEMGQANALSYLVTGKPPDAIGADSDEASLLSSAANSFGAAAGTYLGKQLGVDRVGVEESEFIDGDVFMIGEYLSPRLFLSYGVGLFESGNVIQLEYELSDTINLTAVRGPEETRAGIEYRVER